MPRRDGTWPRWEWSMTGQKMGNCEKNGEKWKNLEFARWRWNRWCGKRKWELNRWKNID